MHYLLKRNFVRFDVSRMTLRQAIKLLAEDGIVESTRGRDTLLFHK